LLLPHKPRRALLNISDGWFTAYIAVCFIGGLRRGEAPALQVGDIDFLRKELHVERQVQWTDDGRMQIRPPKYGSERTVFIPERLVTMLSEHIRLHITGEEKIKSRSPSSEDEDP
jgi:integrase